LSNLGLLFINELSKSNIEYFLDMLLDFYSKYNYSFILFKSNIDFKYISNTLSFLELKGGNLYEFNIIDSLISLSV